MNYSQAIDANSLIDNVGGSPDMILVIPAFNEPEPISVLKSLAECQVPAELETLVIYIFNASATAPPSVKECNIKGYRLVTEWAKEHNNNQLQIVPRLFNNLQEKDAGVGLARKIGMDAAAQLFARNRKPEGLIVNLDVDCTVSDTYLSALYHWQQTHRKMEGCSIYFEHPFPSNNSMLNGILNYELHLRYFIQAQRWAGLPYAFQTIGSAMAVRAEAYKLCGGMNKRKAGEDFYFLHKVIKRGFFENLTSCTVYPSARLSDRVPFGTGRAMLEFLSSKRYSATYSFATFEILKNVMAEMKVILKNPKMDIQPAFEKWPISFQDFFIHYKGFAKCQEIWANANSATNRTKRFFHWFDAFMLMKWCHYAREHELPDEETTKAASTLADQIMPYSISKKDLQNLLLAYRNLDKTHPINNH